MKIFNRALIELITLCNDGQPGIATFGGGATMNLAAIVKKSSRIFTRVVFPALLLSMSADARAEEHSGTIALFHLNGQIPDRGVCVQMVPAVPGTGWACLWKSNPLYKEITALLLEGHATGKSCQIGYTSGPDGHAAIAWATCF